MKRNALPATLTILFCTMLIVGIAPALLADGDHVCSYGSVAGKWGFRYSGTELPSNPIGAVGIFTLDKHGNVSDGKATENDAGNVLKFTFSGTFTVNDDCTGSVIITVFVDGSPIGGGEFDVVWIDNSKEVRMVLIQDNEAFTVDGKKLFPSRD